MYNLLFRVMEWVGGFVRLGVRFSEVDVQVGSHRASAAASEIEIEMKASRADANLGVPAYPNPCFVASHTHAAKEPGNLPDRRTTNLSKTAHQLIKKAVRALSHQLSTPPIFSPK